MAKKGGLKTSFQVDKKYEGLGQLFYADIPIRGLATDIQDEMREPGHCITLQAFPTLKYGWTNVRKEEVMIPGNYTVNNKFSPTNLLFYWDDTILYVYDLSAKTLKYSINFNPNKIIYAGSIDDINAFVLLGNGTTVRISNGSVNGTYNVSGVCAEVYRGRLFIGDGKVLRFSGVNISDPTFTGDPFTSQNGGGWIAVTYPGVSKITDLRVFNDLLYVFTDNGLFFLSSSIASNLPQSFYLTDTGLRWNFDNNKILSIYKRCIVVSELGIFELITTNLERKDIVVSQLVKLCKTDSAGVGFHEGQNILIIPRSDSTTSLCYSFEYDLFFELPFRCYYSVISPDGNTYAVVEGQGISRLFAMNTFYPLHIRTAYHSFGAEKFKHVKKIMLKSSNKCNLRVYYDGYMVEEYMTQYYGDVFIYMSPFGRMGNKISFEIIYDDPNMPFWVNKIMLEGHLLKDLDWMYIAHDFS